MLQEAAERSKKIDKDLRADGEKAAKEVKLLLLGVLPTIFVSLCYLVEVCSRCVISQVLVNPARVLSLSR